MTIVLERNLDKKGRSDEWSARCDGVPFPGIGRDRDQALGCLLRANLPLFGVMQVEDRDGSSTMPVATWKAPGCAPLLESSP